MHRILLLALALALLLPSLATAARRQADPDFCFLEQRTPPVSVAALSPDGQGLATAFAYIDSPGQVWLRDLAGKERFHCKGHTDAVNAMAFSANGKMLASGDWVGVVKIWDTATGKELATLRGGHPRQIWCLCFSPDGRMLASSSPDRVVLWEVATGKLRTVIKIKGEQISRVGPNSGCAVVFSPDSSTLAYSTDKGVVKLWDVAAGKDKAVLQGHTEFVAAAAFAPNGKTLATAGDDSIVRLWQVGSDSPPITLVGHKGPVTSVAFSADGRLLASWCLWSKDIREGGPKGGGVIKTASGSEVKVWDVATGKARLTFEPDEISYQGSWHPRPLQFHADGKTLMTLDIDHAVKHWDLVKLVEQAK